MKAIMIEALYLYYLKHKMKPYIICMNCPEYLSHLSKNGAITLNLSNNATNGYVNFKDELIQIGVCFDKKQYDLEFNIESDVIAIYPFENKSIGMFFQLGSVEPNKNDKPETPTVTATKKRHLKLVK